MNFKISFFTQCKKTQVQAPFLFWSLCLFLCYFTFFFQFFSSIPLFITLFLFIYDSEKKKKFFLFLFFTCLSLFFVHLNQKKEQLPQVNLEGIAHFRIKSIKDIDRSYQKGWKYSGIIKKFVCEDKTYFNIPCQIFIKQKWNRPLGNSDYLISGILKKQNTYFSLKIDGKPWKKVPSFFRLAEYRYQLKNQLKTYLMKKIHFEKSALFLIGISMGIFENAMMQKEFSHLGLQHILAISGFHFSMIAAFFGFFLSQFFSPKKSSFIVIVILFSYFLFIGFSPSVERAFFSSLLFFLGQIIGKKSNALNNLSIALLLLVLIEPTIILQLAFQLSFLATAGIICLREPIEVFLRKIFSYKSFEEIIKMRLLDQHGYFFLSIFRKSISLTLAVHLTTLPILLLNFHKISFLSLVYNLFFPFLVIFSLFLLISGLVLFWIPPLSQFLHWINSHYTQKMLTLTENPSTFIDYVFYCETIPSFIIGLYYSILFLIAVSWKEKNPSHAAFAWI